MKREAFTMIRLTKKEKAQLKRQAKARGKAHGFEGESAYIRWLIERDADRLASGV